jgi:hypothetical protein
LQLDTSGEDQASSLLATQPARTRARAEYILLVDGDTIRHPARRTTSLRRPDCFIRRGRSSAATTVQVLQDGSQTDVGPLTPGLQRRAYALRSPLLSRVFSRTKATLGGVQGCNQSFWRSHAIQVNGYDERFTAWGPEDREFVARLLHLGLGRYYVRHRAIAFHLHHPRASTLPNPFDRLLDETSPAVRRDRARSATHLTRRKSSGPRAQQRRPGDR